ncbi:MAG: isoprenylcysteine carboxylmethyltransferase family protein [Anaerolineales bacterium]|jgi:protein-S-isoprenylcysteine O-methyltransferase Ste14
MVIFNWLAALIVILSLVYVSFVLTLAEWLAALRAGQAVSLLPESRGRAWPMWTQVGLVLVGLALFAGMAALLWIPLFTIPVVASFDLKVIGLILYLAGCVFVLWARRTLGKMWGLSTSQNVRLLDDHRLIQSGPYACVRHPMYFGWWVAMLGLLLLYPVWLVLVMLVFSVVAFIGRARREESALAERFGDTWAAYKRRTRFLIPYLF